MSDASPIETCPQCHETTNVRPKLLLVDEAWTYARPRPALEKYLPKLRADQLNVGEMRDAPLQQFIDGLYCEKCGGGFVPDASIKLEYLRPRK